MDAKEALSSLGLSDKETAVYLAALELGPSPAATIAKKTGVQRTHVYDIAKKLIARGVIGESISRGRTLFAATAPEALVEQQAAQLEKLKQNLPVLNALFNTSGPKPNVYFYEGPDGIDRINEDTLRYPGEIIGFTTPRFAAGSTKSTGSAFIKKRVALKKRTRVIGEDCPENRILQSRDTADLRETRLLSPNVFSSDIEIAIYGDRVALVDYKQNWGLIIENAQIVSALKMLFEITWNRWERW